MKLFGINIGRAKLAAANPFQPMQVDVAPESQPGNAGKVLSPFTEKQPPTENPPTRQAIFLNPRWEPINISQNITAQGVQTAIREAENGETRELFRLYRDALLGDDHIQNCLNARKTALLSMPIAVLPEDKKNPDDVAAAAACTCMIRDCENWIDAMSNFMSGALWPVVVQERIYRPADAPRGDEPDLQWTVKRFEIVNPMLFCFRWAYLTGGIAMGTASPMQQAGLGLTPGNFMIDVEVWEPFFKLWPTDNSGRIIYDTASAQYLDRHRHIVHRGHLITDFRDNWGGPFRAVLGWWLLRQLGRDWFAQFMQTYGKPFLKGKTNVEDQQAIDFLREAFKLAQRLGGIVIGHEDEVELIEAVVAGGAEGHGKFQETCNSAIARFICGQDIERGGSKLDGGADAKLKGTVREDVRMLDQVKLGETVTKCVFTPFLELNGLVGRCKASWGGLSAEEVAATGALLVQVNQAGLEPTDDAIELVSERFGFNVQRAAKPQLPSPGGEGQGEGELDQLAPPPKRKQLSEGSGSGEGAGAAQLRSLTLKDIAARGDGPAITAHPSDAIADRKSAVLAAAYKGSLAPLRQIILDSASPDEAQANVAKFFSDWNPSRVRQVTEEALQLCAAAALEPASIARLDAGGPEEPRDEQGRWTAGGVAPGHIKLRGSSMLNESEKAVHVRVQTDEGSTSLWLPKSQASVNEKGEVHASPWVINAKEGELAERNHYDSEHAQPRILTGDAPSPPTLEEKAASEKQRQAADEQFAKRSQARDDRRQRARGKAEAEEPPEAKAAREALAQATQKAKLETHLKQAAAQKSNVEFPGKENADKRTARAAQLLTEPNWVAYQTGRFNS